MAQKTERKVVTFALKFFSSLAYVTPLHVSFVKYSTGILIGVPNRICLTLVAPKYRIFTSFSIKCLQVYLLNLQPHLCHVSALFEYI